MEASQPAPTEQYWVLLMTAVVVKCDAINEHEAAFRALIEGPPSFDPTQLEWVVRHISTTPIEIGEAELEEEGPELLP
jgi:hypothetical protein